MAVSIVLAGLTVSANIPLHPDPAWVPHPTDIVTLPNLLYEDGPLSGPWIGDLQYIGGRWYAGDGRGGIWHSRDGVDWTRARIVTEQGKPRSMQNAPVRSIRQGANGTFIATFLAGGHLRWPRLQRALGMRARQRAPIARSTDGNTWTVHPVPHSCGIHFSATDGQGTWIAEGCKDRLLVSRDDGKRWGEQSTGLRPRVKAPGYINGVWVVGTGRGEAGTGIYYSHDLQHWTKALAFPKGVVPKRTLSLNGHLIMTGSSRFIASTRNGIDWRISSLTPGGGRTMRAGVWSPAHGYILGGIRGMVMVSRDLKHWRCTRIGIGTRVTGMAISAAGDVLASSMPSVLLRLVPRRLATDRHLNECR